MVKISVIVPVYNVEKYLSECLNSILAQTFNDFEVICVNDGSTDRSSEILLQYAKKDKRIKVITQKNQGLSMARNNGLKEAGGEYVYFMDSDDAIHPQCLEIAYSLAEKQQADLVCFSYIKMKKKIPDTGAFDISKLKSKTTCSPLQYCFGKKYKIRFNVWTKFYRRKLLNGLEFIPKIHFEDYPHTFAVLSKHPKTVIINEALYFYRINENSISHQKSSPQQIKDYHTGISSVYEIYKAPELKKELALLQRKLIPNLLKQQLKRCKQAENERQKSMYRAFAEELADLKQKGWLNWRDHNLLRYWIYKKLIKNETCI